MTVEVYIAVCLTVIVLAIAVVTVFIAMTLWQLRRSARALEVLADRVGSQVGRLEGVVSTLGAAAAQATGRMGRGAMVGASLVWGLVNFLRGRGRSSSSESPEKNKEPLS